MLINAKVQRCVSKESMYSKLLFRSMCFIFNTLIPYMRIYGEVTVVKAKSATL